MDWQPNKSLYHYITRKEQIIDCMLAIQEVKVNQEEMKSSKEKMKSMMEAHMEIMAVCL
jgi:hypothetical protein